MGIRDSKGKFIKGHIPIDKNKDRIFSKEHKEKLSKVRIGKYTGKNCPAWRGGVSKIDKLCRCMPEYIQWRSDCFSRDKWTCQTCGNRGYITVHHIDGFSKLIKENNINSIDDARKCQVLWDISNGVTLCEDCHKLTDNYKGRSKNEQ
jgi:hypothetical protein